MSFENEQQRRETKHRTRTAKNVDGAAAPLSTLARSYGPYGPSWVHEETKIEWHARVSMQRTICQMNTAIIGRRCRNYRQFVVFIGAFFRVLEMSHMYEQDSLNEVNSLSTYFTAFFVCLFQKISRFTDIKWLIF